MCHVTFILFWSWGLWYHNCELLVVFLHGVSRSVTGIQSSYWCPDVADFYRSLFTGLETFNERLYCYILPGLVKVWPQSCQPLLIYSFICCGVAKVCPYILNDYWYTGLWWHFEDTFCQCFNKLHNSLEWFFYPFNSFIYLNYIVYTLKVSHSL